MYMYVCICSVYILYVFIYYTCTYTYWFLLVIYYMPPLNRSRKYLYEPRAAKSGIPALDPELEPPWDQDVSTGPTK